MIYKYTLIFYAKLTMLFLGTKLIISLNFKYASQIAHFIIFPRIAVQSLQFPCIHNKQKLKLFIDISLFFHLNN